MTPTACAHSFFFLKKTERTCVVHVHGGVDDSMGVDGLSEAGLLHQLEGLEPVEEGLRVLGFQIVQPGGE